MRRLVPMAWTYFLPELTLKEMKLVEDKDQKYMESFKMLKNADVNKTEMQLSSSSSKFVSAYCRRKTIPIPDTDQESNSAIITEETPLLNQDTFWVNSGSESLSRKYKLLLFCIILIQC